MRHVARRLLGPRGRPYIERAPQRDDDGELQQAREHHQSSRMRSTSSHAEVSERMTSSPGIKPSRISTWLTDVTPTCTGTRTAYSRSSISLNSVIVEFRCT